MPRKAVTIRILVDRIVDTEGKKGQAVAKLNQLHNTLKDELDAATDPEQRRRIYHDLQYLEGYQSKPAALIADMLARPLHRRYKKLKAPAMTNLS